MQLEEQEAQTRESAQDLQLFRESCDQLRLLMKEAMNAEQIRGKENAFDDPAFVHELKCSAAKEFLNIKTLNRLDKLRFKQTRDACSEVNFHEICLS